MLFRINRLIGYIIVKVNIKIFFIFLYINTFKHFSKLQTLKARINYSYYLSLCVVWGDITQAEDQRWSYGINMLSLIRIN